MAILLRAASQGSGFGLPSSPSKRSKRSTWLSSGSSCELGGLITIETFGSATNAGGPLQHVCTIPVRTSTHPHPDGATLVDPTKGPVFTPAVHHLPAPTQVIPESPLLWRTVVPQLRIGSPTFGDGCPH